MSRNLAFEFLLREKLLEISNSGRPNDGMVSIDQAIIAFRDVNDQGKAAIRAIFPNKKPVKKARKELVHG